MIKRRLFFIFFVLVCFVVTSYSNNYKRLLAIAVNAATSVASSYGFLLAGALQGYGYSTNNVNCIISISTNAQRNYSFDIGSGFNSNVNIIVKDTDGKFLIGGDFSQYKTATVSKIVRVFTNGNLDTSFSVSNVSLAVHAIGLQSDGKILVGGTFTNIGTNSLRSIARLETNGAVDTSFSTGTGFVGPSAPTFVYAISIRTNGTIVCGGSFTNYNGTAANRIVQLLTNGTRDTSFNYGTGFNDPVRDLQLDSFGGLYVSGEFTNYAGTAANRIVKIDTNGTRDASFNYGTGFNTGPASALELQTNGSLLVGGNFTTYNGTSSVRVVRILTNGIRDASFNIGGGPNNPVNDVKVDNNGKIYICGQFASLSGTNFPGFVRLNSDGSRDTSYNPPKYGFTVLTGQMQARHMFVDTNSVYVVGFFQRYGAFDLSFLGLSDITGQINTNSAFNGTNLNSQVLYGTITTSGKIALVGDFTLYAGVTANRIIMLNANGTRDSSFVSGTGFNAQTIAIESVPNGGVIVGGSFTNYNGTTANRIVMLTSTGSIDSSFSTGTGFSAPVRVIKRQPDGKFLVGGDFNLYNGSSVPFAFTRLNTNGTLDTTFTNRSFSSDVRAVDIDSSSNIYAGGNFASYDGQLSGRLIKLTSSGAWDTSFNVSTGFNNLVSSVVVQPDNKVLVGGNFTLYRGASQAIQAFNRLVRLDTNAVVDSTLSIGSGFPNGVNVVRQEPNGYIVVGGNFGSYNGTDWPYLVRMDSSGVRDTNFILQAAGNVYWMAFY